MLKQKRTLKLNPVSLKPKSEPYTGTKGCLAEFEITVDSLEFKQPWALGVESWSGVHWH